METKKKLMVMPDIFRACLKGIIMAKTQSHFLILWETRKFWVEKSYYYKLNN